MSILRIHFVNEGGKWGRKYLDIRYADIRQVELTIVDSNYMFMSFLDQIKTVKCNQFNI